MDFADLKELSEIEKQALAFKYGYLHPSNAAEQGTAQNGNEHVHLPVRSTKAAAVVLQKSVLDVCARVLTYVFASDIHGTNIAARYSMYKNSPVLARGTTPDLCDRLLFTLQNVFQDSVYISKQQVRNIYGPMTNKKEFEELRTVILAAEGAYEPYQPTSAPNSGLYAKQMESKTLDVVTTAVAEGLDFAQTLEKFDALVYAYCDWLLKFDVSSKDKPLQSIYKKNCVIDNGGVFSSIKAVVKSFSDSQNLIEPSKTRDLYNEIQPYCVKILSMFSHMPKIGSMKNDAVKGLPVSCVAMFHNPNMSPASHHRISTGHVKYAETAAAAALRTGNENPMHVFFEKKGKQAEFDFACLLQYFNVKPHDCEDLVFSLIGKDARLQIEPLEVPLINWDVRHFGELEQDAQRSPAPVYLDVHRQTIVMSKTRLIFMLICFRKLQRDLAMLANSVNVFGDMLEKIGSMEDLPADHARNLDAFSTAVANLETPGSQLHKFVDTTGMKIAAELSQMLYPQPIADLADAPLILMAHDMPLEVLKMCTFVNTGAEIKEQLVADKAWKRAGGKPTRRVLNPDEQIEMGLAGSGGPVSVDAEDEFGSTLAEFADAVCNMCARENTTGLTLSHKMASTILPYALAAVLNDVCRPLDCEIDDAMIAIHIGPRVRILEPSLTSGMTSPILHEPVLILDESEFASWPLLGKFLLKIFTCDCLHVDIQPDQSINHWKNVLSLKEPGSDVPPYIEYACRVAKKAKSLLKPAWHPLNSVFDTYGNSYFENRYIAVGDHANATSDDLANTIQVGLNPVQRHAKIGTF